MEVCYVNTGIWPKIIEMTASDWAAWFSAGGTVLAVVAAVWLYWRSRADSKRDITARRRVLHAMLREHVRAAAMHVKQALALLPQPKPEMSRPGAQLFMLTAQLPDTDRLVELQADLLDFGEKGDEVIAAFIEACRGFVKSHRIWEEHINEEAFIDDFLDENRPPTPIVIVHNGLKDLLRKAEPALAAIEQFDNNRE